MKFENIRVSNFDNALRGMRNPKNSWHLSDSAFGIDSEEWCEKDYDVAESWTQHNYPDLEIGGKEYLEKVEKYDRWLIENGILRQQNEIIEYAFIGPKDMRLAKALIKGGPEHRKFMRQIFVSVDITAPLYWWKEFDTYKVGTVANSTSTMHKIMSKPITLDSFEIDDYDEKVFDPDSCLFGPKDIIDLCENLRLSYLSIKEDDAELAQKIWKELIRWTPESWLQTRTVTMNYENLLAICSKSQRRFHKLNEWSGQKDSTKPNFISFARKVPYAADFIFLDEEQA